MGTAREQVRSLLAASVPEKLLDELLEHYQASKAAFMARDWEKCLLRGGKLAEAVMKIIHFLRTGDVVSSIKLEAEIQEAEKSSLPEEVRLLIPRHVRPLYDHRSKRGGGHGSFDPNPLDATMVVALGDWLVGELIRLYGKTSPEAALRLVGSLTARLVPLVEEIDGDLLVHKRDASCRQELQLMLYVRHPERTPRAQLYGWLKNHKRNNIDVTLTRMARANEIHTNADGIVLTAAGIQNTDTLVSQSLP
ncbi:MAG: hypothetical protein ABR978_04275 [Dehalococcoidia bacterium]